MNTRAKRIEAAARALEDDYDRLGGGWDRLGGGWDYLKPHLTAIAAALALPPDPPNETNTTMPKQASAVGAIDALAVETRKVLLVEQGDAEAGEMVYANGMTFWTDPDGRVWEIDCSMRMRLHEGAAS